MALFKKKNKEKKPKKEKTGKKGGKKLLLFGLVGLVLVAAAAFAVVRFVLPRFIGDGTEKDEKKPSVTETYDIGEDSTVAIDTVFEEGEGVLLAKRGREWLSKLNGGDKEDTDEEDKSKEDDEERYTYIYEMTSYAAVVDRYLDVMLGSEQGFSLVDETYLVQEERPELADEEGALLLVRNSVREGRLFQIVIGWSQTSGNLAVRVSAPEGAMRRPEKPKGPEQPKMASVSDQLDTLKELSPAQLTLSGSSMSDYDIYPVEGYVNIDGNYCRRFTIYERDDPSGIAAIIFLSGDQQHIYRMDVDDNSIITQLR